MITIRLETYPDKAGKSTTIGDVEVVRVPFGQDAEIYFQKYTRDYSSYNSRPYVYRKQGYKTLANAVKAVLRDRAKSTALEGC